MPDAPDIASDVAKVIDPDGPAVAFPVDSDISPLVPLVPASPVNIDTFPLDDAVPAPLVRETEPPAFVALDPALIETDPPG